MDNKNILITGGTGSFGQKLVKEFTSWRDKPNLTVLSRDELKQFEMSKLYPEVNFIVGDIRDKARVVEAMKGIDYVVHAAALKQVPILERNPLEAVKTNILGTQNVIDAAIECKVKKVIALSTDKACNPVNLYGATKLCAEKLLLSANTRSDTKFSLVRYGNVFGSRGSVVETFIKQRNSGILTITVADMTRFWITLAQAVDFVIGKLHIMDGGEIFIPKLPTVCITDLANVISPNCEFNITGIRSGEKVHEILLSKDEMNRATEFNEYFVIKTELSESSVQYEYNSGSNSTVLTQEQLKSMLQNYEEGI